MTDQQKTTDVPGVGSNDLLGDKPMTREEWTRKFAARIMAVHKWDESDAMMVAEEVADRDPDGDWLDPEEEADVEMSYWTDDDDA